MLRKRINRIISFFLLLLALPLWGQGGVFPVQVVVQALPPAPIYFSSYADASTATSPLRVQLILNDLGVANREIRLKAYFEGNGISFQSNDMVSGSGPIYLEGGIPLVLANAELAPYFRFENITGISPNVYGQAIPEGAYKFCFEVYDVLTGKRLSQKNCANTVVFKNEPPFLVSPANRSIQEDTDPQNIVFQWTPRSINVTHVEYELSLVEIWDNMVDPQQAFLSSNPVFQTTTDATAYLYGPADPLLLQGKNYAWRVRAMAKQGTEEIGLFKNQGNSEIYSFGYAGACDLPTGLAHEVKGGTNANIFWVDFSIEVPEYTVRYRKKSPSTSPGGGEPDSSPSGGGAEGGGGQGAWFTSRTSANQLTLWDLKAGTTYEYQLQKKCAVTQCDWSNPKEFTTFITDDAASVYECGISPDISLSNWESLSTITSGEAFTAGDFPIRIREVSGSDGRFTGNGYVTIPYLNSIKVAVEFTNVLINTDRQMAEGTVVTKYDPDMKNIVDMNEAVDQIVTAYDAIADLGDTTENILRDVFGEEPDDINEVEVSDEGLNSNYEGGTAKSSRQEETTITNQTNSSSPIAGNNENLNADPVLSNAESIEIEPYKSSEKTFNTKEVVIVYNGKAYRNGDIIKVPYDKKLGKQPFHCVNAPDNSKISWNVQKDKNDTTNLTWKADGSTIVLDIEDYVIKTLEAQYWSPLSSPTDSKSSKVRVGIRVVRKEFDLVELYAKHAKQRIARSGQKLYLIDNTSLIEAPILKEVQYGVKLSPKIKQEEIKASNLEWYYEDNPIIPHDLGKFKVTRKLRLSDDPEKTTVRAGFPTLSDKSVEVVWVDESYSKNDRVFPFGFDLMPHLKELAKKIGIPVYYEEGKYATDTHFSIMADVNFLTESRNKEDKKSRLIYNETQQEYSLLLGIKGRFEQGIPSLSLPQVKKTFLGIDFEFEVGVFFFIEGNATGKIGDTKFTEDWIENKKTKNRSYSKVRDPSYVSLQAKIGLDPKLSLKASKNISAIISGLSFAQAELLKIDFASETFSFPLIQEGFSLKFKPTINFLFFDWNYTYSVDEKVYDVKW